MVLRLVDWLMDTKEETNRRTVGFRSIFRIRHFEFWNTHLFHLPIYLYWLMLACKARSLFFFSASNPGIETGGMMGESKYGILKKINPKYLPKTLFYETATVDQILSDLRGRGIDFPFIVKPDIGQGGWLIRKINDRGELEMFLGKIKMPFILQEFVEDPLELGLLYYRMPGEQKGRISSLAIKELLSVRGDGVSTIRMMLSKDVRGEKQIARLSANGKVDLNRIPARGEVVSLSYVGNHSYGTRFVNGNHLIDEKLTNLFDEVCVPIDGFYFGRFDLRCKSIEAMKEGDFKILELNGAGSEPLHIFDPCEKLRNAYKSALEHWDIIFNISKRNRHSGVRYMTWKESMSIYKRVQEIQKIHDLRFTIGNAD